MSRQPADALPPGCRAACRGCDHRHLSAAASETQKADWLATALSPWRDVLEPLRAVPASRRLGYRDRVALRCQWDGTAQAWRIGLNLRDEVLDIRDCPVHSPRVRGSLASLLPSLPPARDFPLAFYVQAGAQLTLVLKTADRPDTGWLDAATRQALQAAGVEGLWLMLFPAAGRRLFHKRGWRLIWGEPFSHDAGGLRHGPAAFQQLLPALHGQSLDAAQAFLAPGPGDRVVDLYCGNGAGLRRWLAGGARTLGVEIAGEAVDNARHNAPGATLLRGPCAQRLPQVRQWVASAGGGERLLYVNPPRTGLEPEVLDWIAGDCRPRRVAYLSCSAGTLAHDLRRLDAAGYRVVALQPYDFFPQTRHVECQALLERED